MLGLASLWAPSCRSAQLTEQQKEELRSSAWPPYRDRTPQEQAAFESRLDRIVPCSAETLSAEAKYTAANLRGRILGEIGVPLRYLVLNVHLTNPEKARAGAHLYEFRGYTFFSITLFTAQVAPAGGYMVIDGPF
ncbi:MAG: hypothetical protein AB1449_10490 [Chloroflexota bacterium]